MAAVSPKFCPDTLYGTRCSDSSCPLEHDVRICELCVVICAPAANFEAHERGRQHLANVCVSQIAARPVGDQSRRCLVCSVVVPSTHWAQHIASVQHTKHEQLAALRAAYEQAEENKQHVAVSHAEEGIDFGVVSPEHAANGVRSDFTVSTHSSQAITIIRTEIRSRIPNHQSFFSVLSHSPSLTIASGQQLRFSAVFRHSERGRYEARLELTFQARGGHPFMIARRLAGIISEDEDREFLKPVAPYVRGRRVPWADESLVLSGHPPPKPGVSWVRQLQHFPVPLPIRAVLKSHPPEDVAERLEEELFRDTLSQGNHAQFFQTLLWMEEIRVEDDLRTYDMSDVQFEREGPLYTLSVPGLAEKRPSVTVGDIIMAQPSEGGNTFKGVVHAIKQEKATVDFHVSFNHSRRYSIRFQLNRTPLRRMHQALLARISSPQRLLFPVPGFEGLDRPLDPGEGGMVLFNGTIGTNPYQLQAVKSILHLKPGTAPFIVDGPPGTGKTVTIVEAMNQILLQDPKARILACAPSNSAADILAQRLMITLSPEELYRCNAMSRDPASVPAELKPYTYRPRTTFELPSLDTLSKFKVIVTTCVNAAFAYNIGLPMGHFTHKFVDEAGQASEPELLVAVKPLTADDTRIILSGDPKQLGPVVRSSFARDFGLDKSYLERLMEGPLYSAQTGVGTAYVKLIQNYRSHAAILHFPNERFYDGELEVFGLPSTTDSFLGSPVLASPRFPLVFHAISGKNEREASSPSFFNIDEAIQVKAYVVALLNDRRFPISPRDIGVVAPYHAQVSKIRSLLHKVHLSDVKVGSVEEFQGQERRVIILSTVRSSADLLAYDATFTLGFLSNPRRFNVAMTRAKALLIVIGDAAILTVDPLWRAFMNYVYQHDGWRGDAPTWDTNAPVDTEGDYAEELREAIAAEMNTVIASLPPEQDLEAEANVERTMWFTNEGNDASDWA